MDHLVERDTDRLQRAIDVEQYISNVWRAVILPCHRDVVPLIIDHHRAADDIATVDLDPDVAINWAILVLRAKIPLVSCHVRSIAEDTQVTIRYSDSGCRLNPGGERPGASTSDLIRLITVHENVGEIGAIEGD